MRREYRLRRSADFERVRSNRSSWAHPLLVCSKRARDDDGPTRVGIIVGRRVGKAIIRNRVKRRIREAARHLYSRIQPGCDVVVVGRPASAGASFEDLARALETLLTRARLLAPGATGQSGIASAPA